MLTYLLANWKPMLASAAVAGVAGYFAHRCPEPAVHLTESEHTQATTQAKTEQTVQAGPVKMTQTVRDFAPSREVVPTVPAEQRMRGSGPERMGVSVTQGVAAEAGHGPLIRETVTVTEQGPTTTQSHSDTRATATDDRKLDLTVTPAPRAGWALQIGLEDVLHGGSVRVAVRSRLLGPFWAEVAALPRTRAVGVGLSIEF